MRNRRKNSIFFIIWTRSSCKTYLALLHWINRTIKLSFVLIYILQTIHQGYPTETLVRFLKARDGNVSKAHKMVRCSSFQMNTVAKKNSFRTTSMNASPLLTDYYVTVAAGWLLKLEDTKWDWQYFGGEFLFLSENQLP